MKKIFLLSIAISYFAIVSFTNHPQSKTGHDIKVTIHGLQDTVCYLAYHFGDKQYMKDTIKLDNKGSGHFVGDQPLPGGIYLVVTPDKNFFEMIVDEQFFSVETDYSDLTGKLKFTGSSENNLFMQDRQMISANQDVSKKLTAQLDSLKDKQSPQAKEIREQLTVIDKQVKQSRKEMVDKNPKSFYAKLVKTMSEPEIPVAPLKPDGTTDSTFAWRYFKGHYWDDVDFSDDRLLRTPIMQNKLNKYFTQTVPQIPDSLDKAADDIIAKSRANKDVFQFNLVYILNEFANSKIMGMDAVYVYIAKNYYCKSDSMIWWLDEANRTKICNRANILDPLLIGKPSPPLILQDDKGEWASLYDVKANYTILIFWNPDCGHCKKAMPFIVDAYHKYKDRGVALFAVNTEVEEDKWKKGIQEFGIDGINVADIKLQNNFRGAFDVQQTPEIFILDKDKKIKAKRIGGEQVDQILGDFFKFDEMKAKKAGG